MSFELPNSTLVAVFEDGRELKLATDQRDQYRAFRLPGVNADTETTPARMHALRAIAWAAATRLSEYAGTFEDFDDSVAWVVADTDAEATVDPTTAAGAD
jgi:hypothetical protein